MVEATFRTKENVSFNNPVEFDNFILDIDYGQPLGSGGFGKVFAGELYLKLADGSLSEPYPVAVKQVNQHGEFALMGRLGREAHYLTRLTQEYPWLTAMVIHESLLNSIEAAKRESIIIMERLGDDFENLSKYLAKNPNGLPVSEAIQIGIKVLRALMKTHELNLSNSPQDNDAAPTGLIHKDVKPSNIMYSPKTGEVKLMDFGISLPIDASPFKIEGSIQYISPDQLNGKDASTSDDLFSMAVVMYELITGKELFSSIYDSENEESQFQQDVSDQIFTGNTEESGLNEVKKTELITALQKQNVPNAGINQIVHLLDQALIRKKSRRYSSAREFMLDLANAAGYLNPADAEDEELVIPDDSLPVVINSMPGIKRQPSQATQTF